MFEMWLNWWPAYVAGGFGVLAGALASWRFGKNTSDSLMGAVSTEDRIDDIDERTEQLVAELSDLQDQQSKLVPAAYEAQKQAAEQQATNLLRERDTLLNMPAPASLPKGLATPKSAASAQLKGFLWGGGVMAVLAFLFFSVVVEQQPRPEGGSLTGNTTNGGMEAPRPGADATSGEVETLVNHLKQQPSDVDAMLQLVRLLLRNQMFEPAAVLIDRALQLQPENPNAQVFAAVLEAAKGNGAGAMGSLEQILKAHPDLADGWFFRGMLAMQAGNQELMQQSFKQFVATAPEGPQRDRVRAMLGGDGVE